MLSTPRISNGMPRIRIVWWIMAAGLPPNISGTAEPSTAYRWRAASSPLVNIRPYGTV